MIPRREYYCEIALVVVVVGLLVFEVASWVGRRTVPDSVVVVVDWRLLLLTVVVWRENNLSVLVFVLVFLLVVLEVAKEDYPLASMMFVVYSILP